MPHRRYDQSALQRAQEAIAYYDNLIANAQAIKAGAATAEVKAALDNIREMEFDAGARKEVYLTRYEGADPVKAHGLQQMQRAYQNVITLFEKPDDMIAHYRSEKSKEEQYLENAKRGLPTGNP